MVEVMEGAIPLPGGTGRFRRVGNGHATPLLVIHGGPGAGSGYLAPLEDLARERPVIFWDQLGSPGTQHRDDPDLWQMARFVDEVECVRSWLGLDRIHVLGHSWGGWLAIEYLLGHADGVASVVLTGTSAGVAQFASGVRTWRRALPSDVQAILDWHEEAGDLRNPRYLDAAAVYYERHVLRHPRAARTLLEAQLDLPVFNTMQGPNELVIDGNLADWDRSDRLRGLAVRALVINGSMDHVAPQLGRDLARLLPNASFREFTQSAHSPFFEERSAFCDLVATFLRHNDWTKRGQ